ncbi:MAG: chromate transporter, chromate ion transporter family [bacterium]|nr:chromate transporter, chromate ion transporter family [bacterium]
MEVLEASGRSSRRHRLLELAVLFLRLGVTAFGGPAAHIAMMEDEVVVRRKWLTREEFLDLLGATNLIPGPNSTEMAIHIGGRRAGWPGLLVAGVCFIVPAAVLVAVIAWAYVRFGSLPRALSLLDGVKPVIVAIVAQALARLARGVVKSWWLAVVTAGAVVAAALGVNELVILAAAGMVAAAVKTAATKKTSTVAGWFPLGVGSIGSAAAAKVSVALVPLFLVFLKVGSVLFGSGYVLLAFLRSDLVERYHWLTSAQLLDAVAVGQVTPGPVFTTATFVGFLLRGPMGAVAATIGIFLPAFVFVAISGPLVPRLRRSPVAGAILDGVNAASIALMAVVTFQLGRTAIVGGPTAAVALFSLAVLLRTRVNSVWLVLVGGLVGVLMRL